MVWSEAFLPDTGRWQPEGLTEGVGLRAQVLYLEAHPLHHRFAAVPLPVPGRRGC